MPESKKDQSLRVHTEIANFVECGDARGQTWLAKHPADVDRAASVLRRGYTANLRFPKADCSRRLTRCPGHAR